MSDTLDLCFGVHHHQPVGSFECVVEEATRRADHPFLSLVRRRPELRLTVHTTGNLLEGVLVAFAIDGLPEAVLSRTIRIGEASPFGVIGGGGSC